MFDVLLEPTGFSGVANTQSSFLMLARLMGVLSSPLSTDRDGDNGLLVDKALKWM